MPTPPDHPDMLACRCKDQSRNKQNAIQCFKNSRLGGKYPTHRYFPDKYHRDVFELNTGRQLRCQCSLQNNLEVVEAIQMPQTAQKKTSYQSQSVNKARRTSQVINGVLHINPMVFPNAAAPVTSFDRRSPEGTNLTTPSTTQHTLYQTPRAEGLAQFDPSIGFPRTSEVEHIILSKGLTGTTNVPEVISLDTDTSKTSIDTLRANVWHHELFYDENAQQSLVPLALKASVPSSLELQTGWPLPHGVDPSRDSVCELPGISLPSPEIYHSIPTKPALSSNEGNAIEYRIAQRPAELNTANEAVAFTGGSLYSPSCGNGSPVSPETVAGRTPAPIDDVQQQTSTPLYELYKGMRTWEFEDVTEAYKHEIYGPLSPPLRHSGGFEWFYGCEQTE